MKMRLLGCLLVLSSCSPQMSGRIDQTDHSRDEKIQQIITRFGEEAIFENEFLIQGDQAIRIEDVSLEDLKRGGPSSFSSNYGPKSLWPNGVVPIQFRSRRYEDQVWRACRLWGLTANVKCVLRRNEKAFVEVVEDHTAITSFATRGYSGQKKHIVNLIQDGVAVHEMGHIFGLGHEHQRPDRDQYVTVFLDRVDPQFKHAMELRRDDRTIGPYDFHSVMHYPKNAWQNSGETRDTIIPKPGYEYYRGRIGSVMAEPSFGDAKSMRSLYGPPKYQEYGLDDNALDRRCRLDEINEGSDSGQAVMASYCLILDRLPDVEEKREAVQLFQNSGQLWLFQKLLLSNEFVQKHDFLFKDFLTRQLIVFRVFLRRNASQDDLKTFKESLPGVIELAQTYYFKGEFQDRHLEYFVRNPDRRHCDSSFGAFAVCRPDAGRCTQTIPQAATKTRAIYRGLSGEWSEYFNPRECTLDMLRDSPRECGACNVYRHLIAFPGKAGFESGAKWLAQNSNSVENALNLEQPEFVIEPMYREWLGRPSDPGGLEAHSNQFLDRGIEGLKQSIESFVRSDEFRFD